MEESIQFVTLWVQIKGGLIYLKKTKVFYPEKEEMNAAWQNKPSQTNIYLLQEVRIKIEIVHIFCLYNIILKSQFYRKFKCIILKRYMRKKNYSSIIYNGTKSKQICIINQQRNASKILVH